RRYNVEDGGDFGGAAGRVFLSGDHPGERWETARHVHASAATHQVSHVRSDGVQGLKAFHAKARRARLAKKAGILADFAPLREMPLAIPVAANDFTPASFDTG